jgi:superfamily II DNA or RNA helicase
MLPIAPGARVLIRDEEWLIRRVDHSNDGGRLLACDGVSELVRGRSAYFLTELEGEIQVLDPAATDLIADDSPHFNAAILYLEAQMRCSAPNDELIHLGHSAVMNLVRYQLDPALQALRQPRQRILIADSTGLGKTLEAGILVTELIRRGRGQRILVITLKSMLTQFQKEFWCRFTIPLVRLDSLGLQRVRNNIPSNHNPFNYYDRTIISIDTLKNNLEYRNYLENAWWDIIVIDECHNVAARGAEDGLSRRARLALLLAGRSDTLILLSATPHDGSARSFASLMSLLDPTAISDPDDYTPEDYRHKGLVIRRFKKDIRDQVAEDFPERVTLELRHQASKVEEAAYRALLEIPFTQKGEHIPGPQQELQRVGMQKAMFSSPMAALESSERRLDLLGKKERPTPAENAEATALQAFASALRPIDASNFSKFKLLCGHLKSKDFGWKPDDIADRLVIFSERIETLSWLKRELPPAVGLKPEQIEILHGTLPDTDQQELVERFGRGSDPLRLLLCSDVASEGLNLHHFCHRLVHFDLPWSLMVFQQRNGRIDRYSQKKQPRIVYLFTDTAVEQIRGDLRILEILQKKDEQANKNLGDPMLFLRVFDPEKEATKVAEKMAAGMNPQDFEEELNQTAAAKPQQDTDGGDWLLEYFSDTCGEQTVQAADPIARTTSLFGSDYEFALTAFKTLSWQEQLAQYQADDKSKTIRVTAPFGLQERLKTTLPLEVRDAANTYTLCADKHRVIEAIEVARQAGAGEDTWPELQYLWPQHPIIEWLSERVLSAFGRHVAPVIRCARLNSADPAFVMKGLVPNRKGKPLLVEWRVAVRGKDDWTLEPFPEFAARVGLKAGALSNPGEVSCIEELKTQLPDAVAAMHKHMVAEQKLFAVSMKGRLSKTLDDLARLQGKQIQQLELRLAQSKQAEQLSRGKRERRTHQIRKVFDEYRQWVEDSMSTEPQPFIQVLATVVR